MAAVGVLAFRWSGARAAGRSVCAAVLVSLLPIGACDHKSRSGPLDAGLPETTASTLPGDGGSDDGPSGGGDICQNAALGAECAPAVCVDSHTARAAGACDGKGNCNIGATIACDPLFCVGSSCARPCVDSSGCSNGSACINGSCQVRRPNGKVCAAGAECVSGFCSPDQICCDTACAGTCMACSAEATGQAAGICAPVRAGLDPRDGCPIDTAESCGRNGACDGAGSCALYGGGTQCAASFCDASGRFVAARMCGGGACAPAAPEDCGLRICDAASGCRQTCSGDGDCTASGYCDAHTSVCAPKQANGAVCGGAHECATGNCVDGVCCDTACAGVCVSCRAAENGQPADGTCADVIDGTDPENECAAGSASCGLDGFCGHGRCRLAPPTVTCGAPACVNGLGNTSATLTPSAQCDGQGACGAATPVPCPGSVLCLSNQLCRPTICSGDADCISGFYCAAGACTAQQVIGGMCSANDQCVTGVCSAAAHGDGVCCANANSVCGGGCAQGYGLCSTGLSCQPTAWNFDGLLDNSSLPFHWNPDSQSAVFYSTTMNHTPGGIGALGVLAGTPWDAMPNVRLCADDPGNDGVTYIDVGGKRLDAWVLFHGPPTTSSCFFVIEDDPNSPGSFLVLSYVETPLDVWMEMSQLVPLSVSNAVVFGIECKVDDGWPGQLYIDDVSIR